MKTYSAIPTLTGVISDDYLFYEGTARPQAFFLISDGKKLDRENILELEHYFNDLYNLFLRKLTSFAVAPTNDEEEIKLQALLQELIKVKNLLKM